VVYSSGGVLRNSSLTAFLLAFASRCSITGSISPLSAEGLLQIGSLGDQQEITNQASLLDGPVCGKALLPCCSRLCLAPPWDRFRQIFNKTTRSRQFGGTTCRQSSQFCPWVEAGMSFYHCSSEKLTIHRGLLGQPFLRGAGTAGPRRLGGLLSLPPCSNNGIGISLCFHSITNAIASLASASMSAARSIHNVKYLVT